MTVAEADPADDPNWKEAEKFYGLEVAVSTIARRAIEFNIVRFALILADDYDGIAQNLGKYNGALPILINKKRYLCYYKLGPNGKL